MLKVGSGEQSDARIFRLNKEEIEMRSWKVFENKSLNRFFAVTQNNSYYDYFYFYIYYQVVIVFFNKNVVPLLR